MRLLFVFPFVFAASVSAQASVIFQTGNEFLRECEPTPTAFCLGVAAGYSDMLAVNGQICKQHSVTVAQVKDVIVKFLREHPENRHYSAASLAGVALTDAFPCPQKKK
jgi:hypothetical protein